MDNKLEKWLAENNITYKLYKHPPVFTVPEAKKHCGHIPGTHCKNLILKNKRTGQLYLVTIPYNRKLNINHFRRMISAPKVRFAEESELNKVLGITTGAVSPLALVNDKSNEVIFMVEKAIWNAEAICCHPNINSETLQIPGDAFRRLMKATGAEINIKELSYL